MMVAARASAAAVPPRRRLGAAPLASALCSNSARCIVTPPPHHTHTHTRARTTQVLLISPRVALALPDCRSARTETQVLALDTHMNLIVKTDVSETQSGAGRRDGNGTLAPHPHCLGPTVLREGAATTHAHYTEQHAFKRTNKTKTQSNAPKPTQTTTTTTPNYRRCPTL